MTNIQLLLAIGIPSLLVFLSWLSNNSRHDRTDSRLDAIDAKFDRKFEAVNGKFDAKFEAVGKRFDDVIAAVHNDSLEIMRSMTALHERIAVVETKQNQ